MSEFWVDRSPLGAFYRSPLGVRTGLVCPDEDIMGGCCVGGSSVNDLILDFSGVGFYDNSCSTCDDLNTQYSLTKSGADYKVGNYTYSNWRYSYPEWCSGSGNVYDLSIDVTLECASQHRLWDVHFRLVDNAMGSLLALTWFDVFNDQTSPPISWTTSCFDGGDSNDHVLVNFLDSGTAGTKPCYWEFEPSLELWPDV